MRVSGSLYECNNGSGLRALALYGKYSDIYTALPPSISGKHLMHVKYGFQSKEKSIDIYAIDNFCTDHIDLKRTLHSSNNASSVNVDEVFKMQNVRLETIVDMQGSVIEKELYKTIATDIKIFCKNPASKPLPLTNDYVDHIMPVTRIGYVNAGQLLTTGKAEFVKECILEANMDFVSSDAECATSFIPSFPNASFKDGIFTGFYDNTFASCDYCYASSKHKRPYSKSFVKLDADRLLDELKYGTFTDFNGNPFGKKVKVLRFGKRTEAGAIYNRPQLITTLETCIKTGTSTVMPTKMLEFDSGLVELLKRTNSKVLFSYTGLDSLERGAAMHGCTNEWRLEQAKKYLDAGVDASIYLALEIVYDTKIEHRKLIQDMLAYGFKIQLLGFRITNKGIAMPVTGRNWEQLKGEVRSAYPDSGLFENTQSDLMIGGYSQMGNNTLSPAALNPYLAGLIKDNHGKVRLCHHNDQKTWCGGCFLNKGGIAKTTEMDIQRVKRIPRKKEDKGKELSKTLDFDYGV